MSIRNIELQTESLPVTSTASGITIGGQVASGMKRWVTFITLDSAAAAGASSVRLYLASVGVSNPTAASIMATSNRKMLLDLRATGIAGGQSFVKDGPPLQVPDAINTDAPLFSIAGGKWLGVFASYTTANVFVQYYDE